MKYHVESIGASFNDKEIVALTAQLNSNSSRGWDLDQVFSVEKRGCLGSSEGRTYLAVFKRDE